MPNPCTISHPRLAASATLVRADASNGYRVVTPIDGSDVGIAPDMSVPEALKIAERASAAFAEWRREPLRARSAALERWADLIDEHAAAIAELIVYEVGKPRAEAVAEVAYASGLVRAAVSGRSGIHDLLLAAPAGARREVVHRPIGPVLAIVPWNLPLAIAARSVAPALVAGCSVVLKPAEQTPFSALVLAELWRRAGGHRDAFQVLSCERPADAVGECLVNGAFRKLTFTGSPGTGSELYRLAASQMMRVAMELGGNAPFIVFDDADPAMAARQILRSKFRIAGQNCTSVNRVFVHRPIAAALKRELSRLLDEVVLGDPRDESTTLGPVIDEQGRAKIAEHLEDAVANGADVLRGGRADSLYVEPTLVWGVGDDMRMFRGETFGPVLGVSEFDTEDEAIERGNNVPEGLAGYVCSADLERAHRVADALEVGIVGVNEGAPTGDPAIPFGGTKRSGIGRSGGEWGVREYLEPQYRHIALRG